jgi:hypothetical protein
MERGGIEATLPHPAGAGVWRQSWAAPAAPAALLLAALALRLVWAAIVPVAPVSDCAAYDTFARNLAAGTAYGWDGETHSAYWPVGTAFVYSLAYRAADPEQWGYAGVVALNLMSGMAVVWLGMALAMRWFGRPAGLCAGAILAVWPVHVQFTTVIASEMLFTAAMLGGVLAWPDKQRGGVLRLILAVLLFAGAVYVRPTAVLLPVVLSAASVLRQEDLASTVRRIAVVMPVMLIAVLPWSMRNQAVFGQFVLVSTNGGANFWMGNSPGSDGRYQRIPPQPAGMNEAEFDRVLRREAMEHIRQEPAAFVKRTLVKGLRLHERQTIGMVWNREGLLRVLPHEAVEAIKWQTQGYWLGVLSMAIAGGLVLARRNGIWLAATHPAVMLWAYFAAVHAVIVYQDRYHFPATPLIAALAGVCAVELFQRMRSPAGVEEER